MIQMGGIGGTNGGKKAVSSNKESASSGEVSDGNSNKRPRKNPAENGPLGNVDRPSGANEGFPPGFPAQSATPRTMPPPRRNASSKSAASFDVRIVTPATSSALAQEKKSMTKASETTAKSKARRSLTMETPEKSIKRSESIEKQEIDLQGARHNPPPTPPPAPPSHQPAVDPEVDSDMAREIERDLLEMVNAAIAHRAAFNARHRQVMRRIDEWTGDDDGELAAELAAAAELASADAPSGDPAVGPASGRQTDASSADGDDLHVFSRTSQEDIDAQLEFAGTVRSPLPARPRPNSHCTGLL